jgi:hypothetical protein
MFRREKTNQRMVTFAVEVENFNQIVENFDKHAYVHYLFGQDAEHFYYLNGPQ